jgi:DNA primase
VISEETINDVKKIPIVDVISTYLKLKKGGATYKAECPFHTDKTASFTVFPATDTYKCFGCDVAGDGIQFVKEHLNYTYPEAIEELASNHHITVRYTKEYNTAEAIAKREEKKTSLQLLAELQIAYTKAHTEQSLAYFKSRGFEKEHVEFLGYGFAPKGSTIAQQVFREQPKLGRDLGYVLDNENNHTQFDFFSNRVIIPIRNKQGKVIAFAGRIIDDSEKAPKWMNSRNAEGIYNKSETLYGFNRALRAIGKNKVAHLCEGYFDVDAAFLAGMHTIVACCGTALTEGHIVQMQAAGANALSFIPDQDSLSEEKEMEGVRPVDRAGIQSALRGVDLATEMQLFTEVIELPQPDIRVKVDLHSFIMSEKLPLLIPS